LKGVEVIRDARDYITCANCSRNMVPRLWHYTSFGVTRTRHTCPFCGHTYVTGPKGAVVLAFGALNAFLRLVNLVGDMAGADAAGGIRTAFQTFYTSPAVSDSLRV
jgi:hypothetical protein